MIAIIGIGAIGSWLTLFLARPEWQLLLWDDDRVGQENLGTSAFSGHHIGAFKAIVASELAAGKGCYAEYITDTLERSGQLANYDVQLVVDCLDNTPSRGILYGLDIPTVHVGVSDSGSGAIIWDEHYQVPDDGYARGENIICTHDLSRAVLRMAAVVAANVVEDFMSNGVKRNQLITSNKIL